MPWDYKELLCKLAEEGTGVLLERSRGGDIFDVTLPGLQALGADGWELIGVAYDSNDDAMRYVFKRQR